MKKNTKVILWIFGGIMALLFITNPKYDDFKNYMGKLSENETLEVRNNYLIFSFYSDSGYKQNSFYDDYLGILGNFYLIKHKGIVF